MMRIRRPQRRDFDNGHHAAIFMREDVTMDYIEARVVYEATPHLEIARYQDGLFCYRIYYRFSGRIRCFVSRWNWKHIPPNQIGFSW